MKRKRLIGALLAASVAVSATFTGCSLVSTNNKTDMEQVIATVDISSAGGLTERDGELISKYSGAVGTSNVIKRELLAYFLNAGYSQVQSGASYSVVFESLLDSLVENCVLTQYAIMYVLDYKAAQSSAETVLGEYNAQETYTAKLEYLLKDPVAYPEDSERDIKIAKYNLFLSINNAIDSYEQKYLEDEESAAGSDSRATPSGVDSVQDDYYPADENGGLGYNVYTGYLGYQLAESGAYKDDAQEGTTKATRVKAYNDFLAVLVENGLIDPQKENLRETWGGIEYIKTEYEGQLESRLLEKYYDLYEKEQEEKLTQDGTDNYLQKIYEDLLRSDESKYKKVSSFGSAMDNFSDSSFLLYSPDTEGEGTFGYVYNILLPFNAVQSARLTELQSISDYKDDDGNYNFKYYNARKDLLNEITTVDQRSAWFNGTTDYSFKATDDNYFDKHKGEESPYGGASRGYLFFENNLTDNAHYKPLEKYDGRYAYNGYVYEKEEGNYVLIPNRLNIDDMLEEFENYLEFVLGGDNDKVSVTKQDKYYNFSANNFYKQDGEEENEIDYENFIYATGKVDFGNISEKEYRGNLFNKESAQYKALSAVNELQYAYTTDTGVLSEYIGYTVTLGDTTGYIKEFETAAQKAIANGAGSFSVCAGDYGWHLIYVTYTFGNSGDGDYDGEVYSPDWSKINVEGTFENLFYEWIKSKDIDQISATRRTQLIYQFKNENTTVKKFTERYKDLLELDS